MYTEMIEFSALSPEGLGGKLKYRENIVFKVKDVSEMDEAIERAKTDFALKYRVDRRLVQIYRDFLN